jgi:hypothetical protein
MMDAISGDSRVSVRAPVGTELDGDRLLAPLRSRWPWVVWGLIIQALGVGGVAVVMWRNVHDQGFGGHVTAEMVAFAWHSEIHNRTALTVLVVGAVIYAVGSVVMARPYISRPTTLLVAVPIAAVVGMLLLGVLAFVVAAFISAFANNGGCGFGGGVSRRDRRKDRQ